MERSLIISLHGYAQREARASLLAITFRLQTNKTNSVRTNQPNKQTNNAPPQCATIEEAREWHAAIAKALRVGCQPHRPKALLLVINPYGGARRADAVWRDVVEPILTLAGVKAVVHRTDRPVRCAALH